MIRMNGKDDFDGCFDYFKWSAPIYETPQEFMEGLRKAGCVGKKLMGIKAIGYCPTLEMNIYSEVYDRLDMLGHDLDEGWEDSFGSFDRVWVPPVFKLYEPVQFLFSDGSTLELLPMRGGCARIGTNTIPVDLNDGLNRSNFDAQGLLNREIPGRRLESVYIRGSETTERVYSFSSVFPPRQTTSYEYDFHFSHLLSIRFTSRGSCRFDLAYYDSFGSEMTYGDLLRLKKPVRQIPIVPGRDYGGSFWITAFNSKENGGWPGKNRYGHEGLSIDDYYVCSLLGHFLRRHLDNSIQKRAEHEKDGFEEYGENYYTFETMRKMIADIRVATEMLDTDFDHPELDPIIRWFPTDLCDDIESLHRFEKAERRKAKKEQIRKNRHIAIDFYDRFTRRMETMLREAEDCDCVTFSGP